MLEVAVPLLQRIRSEFREMPGLCLSVSQAARLWNLDAQTSAAALHVLVDHGFLSQTGDGRFIGAQWATRPAGSRSRSLGD